MLRIRDLSVRYGAALAVRAASFDVEAGQLICLTGPNGAGKTSLLSAIAGVVDAQGEVALDGRRIDAVPAERRAADGIALVPAGRRLFGSLTVEQNLIVGATVLPRTGWAAAVRVVLERFSLLSERRAQRADTLSGGEGQLLMIARALVASPRVLLVDEPFQGLSAEAAELVLGVTRAVTADGTAVVLASPDPIADIDVLPILHGTVGVSV